MDTDKPSETARARILLVDDDPGNLDCARQVAATALRCIGRTFRGACIADRRSAPKPDLILLDVLMPDMDGYDVLARLRDNPATRDIPVIFVTGMDSARRRRDAASNSARWITSPSPTARPSFWRGYKPSLNSSVRATGCATRMPIWRPR